MSTYTSLRIFTAILGSFALFYFVRTGIAATGGSPVTWFDVIVGTIVTLATGFNLAAIYHTKR
ncbi:hypothetical protein HYW61_01005 [candidate division WWE3 bacterium]|nr:hypothetical protein [candidate division WWE3 bacterium]